MGVSWFTVGFFSASRLEFPSSTGARVAANTSEMGTHPDKACTHWQQTFLFLKDVEPVSPGGALEGTIEVKRMPGSPRDLTIILKAKGRDEDSFTVVGAEG